MSQITNPLLTGILADARSKAERIIADAQKDAAEIVALSEEKALREAEIERKGFSMKLEQIAQKEESAKRNIDRLSQLRNLDASYRQIMQIVEEKLKATEKDPSFSSVLEQWIAEAAIGLGLTQAKVSAGKACRVDASMLSHAASLVKNKTGLTVSLSLDEAVLPTSGVAVSSMDGKVSFNNQIDVRERRFNREIKEIVQDTTCKAE